MISLPTTLQVTLFCAGHSTIGKRKEFMFDTGQYMRVKNLYMFKKLKNVCLDFTISLKAAENLFDNHIGCKFSAKVPIIN